MSSQALHNYPKAFLVDVMVAKDQLYRCGGLKEAEKRLIGWQIDGEEPGAKRKRLE
jgi:hypothetical protein